MAYVEVDLRSRRRISVRRPSRTDGRTGTVAAGLPGSDREKESFRSPLVAVDPTREGDRCRVAVGRRQSLWGRHDVLPLKRADATTPPTGGARTTGDVRDEPASSAGSTCSNCSAIYRVLSRRSIVEQCFDGHPFAASRAAARARTRGASSPCTRCWPAGRATRCFSLTGSRARPSRVERAPAPTQDG